MWVEIPNDTLLNIGQNKQMNKQITIIVIATRSISLADGLGALLKAIPQVEKIEIARTMEDALIRIEDIKPNILLLDLALAGKKPELFLEKIISLSPETLRVLLVDNALDDKWQPQYAEAVLIKGVSPAVVAATLTNLLFEKGDDDEQI
jgi:DNA-binding NarL/FixJ family response regulator